MASGASKSYRVDLKEEFLDDYAFLVLKARAKYENYYLLGTALARPLIAKVLVDICKKEDCKLIVHGCTGKGK